MTGVQTCALPISPRAESRACRARRCRQESGKQRTYLILGPWDVNDDSTINYRAPIAHGILGLSVGETGNLPSPNGPIAVRIERVERAI